MRENELRESVREAFVRATPDRLDAILEHCAAAPNNIHPIPAPDRPKERPRWKRAAGLAAMLAVILLGAGGLRLYQLDYAVAATVSLDVNPSISIQVNTKERVLSVEALNEDGRAVIGDMDFSGSTLDVTVNALVGSMLRNGYLSELANSILVSVDDKDPQAGAALQSRLAEEIDQIMSTNAFQGAVLSQTISGDGELQSMSETYGITQGKASLIRQIMEQNTTYSVEDLAGLSINELNLLSQTGKISLDQVETTGSASEKAYIGVEEAKKLALQETNVEESRVFWDDWEMDYEQGTMVYELEFYVDGVLEYECAIEAQTGEVLYLYANPRQTNGEMPSDPQIKFSADDAVTLTAQDAKNAALAHAGLEETAVSRYKCELDREGGRTLYQIDFSAGGFEYEYDVDAQSGEILKSEKEWDD